MIEYMSMVGQNGAGGRGGGREILILRGYDLLSRGREGERKTGGEERGRGREGDGYRMRKR